MSEIMGYKGLFFDSKTMKELENKQGEKLMHVVPDMHVTFFYGKLTPFPEDLLGKEFKIKVVGYASDGKNSGFQVELPKELEKYYQNQNGPHITVSLGEVDGKKARAFDTGLLDFKTLDEPFEISGELGYFINGKGKVMDNRTFEKKKENSSMDEI